MSDGRIQDAYFTLMRDGEGEFSVSRSRFICRSAPVSGEDEAFAYIEKIRKAHWAASHHVWAYALLSGGQQYSDDGEPQGTAGLPVLELIRKEGLSDALVVVTRYFGGIKLGAGGLVRAYAHAAKTAIEAGGIIERRRHLAYHVTLEYALADKLKKKYGKLGYTIKDALYLDQVTLNVLILPTQKEAFHALTAELTGGKTTPVVGEEEFLSIHKAED